MNPLPSKTESWFNISFVCIPNFVKLDKQCQVMPYFLKRIAPNEAQ